MICFVYYVLIYLCYVFIVICLVYYVLMHSSYTFIVTVIMYELCILCVYIVFLICSVILDYFHIHMLF
jgi:hypothetical protein